MTATLPTAEDAVIAFLKANYLGRLPKRTWQLPDWSGIRDSSHRAKEKMLERALKSGEHIGVGGFRQFHCSVVTFFPIGHGSVLQKGAMGDRGFQTFASCRRTRWTSTAALNSPSGHGFE